MGHHVHYESTREKLKMLLLVKQFKNALEDILIKSEHSNICKRFFLPCLSFVNAAKAHYDHKLTLPVQDLSEIICLYQVHSHLQMLD